MEFEQEKVERLLKKNFFISPSAHIYGGVSGLYDYGPYGCPLKNNFINFWRKFFIIEEMMYELDTTILTPYEVLKASGHVDKFCDLLVFDKVTGEFYRADHLLKQEFSKMEETDQIKRIIDNLDCLNIKECDGIIKAYEIKSPNNNELGNTTYFNLMFSTFIGPKTQNMAFLRPETAQGQFINFKKLYELNNSKLPFASASIGKVFRNEISPRSGLLRVREFEQAEIEYFVHPKEKDHPKFQTISDLKINLHFSKENEIQKTEKMSIGDAVKNKIINNQSLGYFIGRTKIFLEKIGINEEYLRFRQHKKDEMAHYACDCWDAEIYCSYGWIECVGIADRSCYDLTQHQIASKTNLNAHIQYSEPKCVEFWKPEIDKKAIASILKEKTGDFLKELNNLPEEFISKNLKNNILTFQNIEIKFIRNKKNIYVEEFVPGVIEPSFGIGRIIYCLCEHSFYTRKEDEERGVMKFVPRMAPLKVVITLLKQTPSLQLLLTNLKEEMSKNDISFSINTRNVSIGRKYASNDEIGVPFFITIDLQSMSDKKATIRERDTMEQIRVPLEKIPILIQQLCNNNVKWENLKNEYGLFVFKEEQNI
ncbi:glycine--tRNA ligase [Hamiltosporidium tvaerminnensis]|uniref:glycine--tRNA ligase n=1 Tax=Hamiltosporidium tvaerminnensis TaxID=1176355 RepID=A0A4V2JXS5_9MICR|nr:glycine--tRNA ligase [Hamiltosporidium tvaerminnensis]